MNVTTLFFLSFPRRRESMFGNKLLDARFRGHDICVGN